MARALFALSVSLSASITYGSPLLDVTGAEVDVSFVDELLLPAADLPPNFIVSGGTFCDPVLDDFSTEGELAADCLQKGMHLVLYLFISLILRSYQQLYQVQAMISVIHNYDIKWIHLG